MPFIKKSRFPLFSIILPLEIFFAGPVVITRPRDLPVPDVGWDRTALVGTDEREEAERLPVHARCRRSGSGFGLSWGSRQEAPALDERHPLSIYHCFVAITATRCCPPLNGLGLHPVVRHPVLDLGPERCQLFSNATQVNAHQGDVGSMEMMMARILGGHVVRFLEVGQRELKKSTAASPGHSVFSGGVLSIISDHIRTYQNNRAYRYMAVLCVGKLHSLNLRTPSSRVVKPVLPGRKGAFCRRNRFPVLIAGRTLFAVMRICEV
jgi:hypothetical protein